MVSQPYEFLDKQWINISLPILLNLQRCHVDQELVIGKKCFRTM